MSIIQGSAMQGATRGFYPRVIEGSLRFNDGDESVLTWTPDSAGTEETWTWSAWVKRCEQGSWQGLLAVGTSDGSEDVIAFDTSDRLTFRHTTGSDVKTSAKFRDPSAWYHIMVVADSTQSQTSSTASDSRIRFYLNGSQVVDFDEATMPSQNHTFRINTAAQHYLGEFPRINAHLQGYLADVHFIDGQALDASDFGETKNGVWVAKDYTGTFGTNGFLLTFEDDTEVEAFNTVLYKSANIGANGTQSVTGLGYEPDLVWLKNRSSSGTSHTLFDTVRGRAKMLQSDSTSAETNTSIYGYLGSFDSDGFTLNGGTTNANYVAQGTDSYVAWGWDAGANNASTGHSSVTYTGNGTDNTRISGLPFTPDLIWGKKRSASGSHFLLDSVRGVNSTLSSDSTGAEDTTADIFRGFDTNGFILGDNGQSNSNGVTYVAWAWDAGDSDPVSNTDGTITSTVKTNGDFSIISYQGTMADASIGHGLSAAPDFLIIKNRNRSAGTNWIVQHSSVDISKKLTLNATTAADAVGNIFGSTPTAMDATKFYVGNVNWVNNNVSGENDHIAYAWRNVTGKQKFGSYTGNGSATGPTVNLGFRPGLVMIKGLDRSSVWYVFDTSRQPFNDPTNYTDHYLLWNSSNAEYTNADDGKIEVTSTGFQIRASVSGMNASGEEYIYAAFAGSYSDFITDYNTDGSIDSRVKANDTTGFSIVSYKGNATQSTIGHGLSSAPDFLTIKNRNDGSSNWITWHSSLSTDRSLYLNLNGAENTNAPYFFGNTVNMTVPTNSVFTVGSNSQVNGNNQDIIAYCWTEKTGYSKFGSYEGNNTATGPTVTLGWQPALVIIKNADGTGNWNLFDNTRATFPDNDLFLRANLSAAEVDGSGEGADAYEVEFTSTGFIPKASGASSRSQVNGTGTYIYAAFADTREAAFWLDQSGNDNDWQPVNLDHNDTVADSPTDNFATLNPLAYPSQTQSFSDGNLRAQTNTGNPTNQLGTIGVSSGKFYWEVYFEAQSGSDDCLMVGIVESSTNLNSTRFWETSTGYAYEGTQGRKFISGTGSTYGDSFTVGDTIGIALDMDAGTLAFYKNGVSQGQATSGLSGTFLPAFSDNAGSSNATFVANFGQQPFKYGPPE